MSVVQAPIPNRRKFSDYWDEIEYLYFKAGHWMFERDLYSRAEPFVGRLKRLLLRNNVRNDSLLGAEAKGLVARFEGDLGGEIRYIKVEIDLLKDLLRRSPRNSRYEWSDLLDSMEILALLFEDKGQRFDALKTVDACLRFARQHKLKFDAGDLKRRIWKAL